MAHVGVSPSIGLKLFGGEIIFEVLQHMWSGYLNVTDRQTDREQTTYSGITALYVASRGKKQIASYCNAECFEYSVRKQGSTSFFINLHV